MWLLAAGTANYDPSTGLPALTYGGAAGTILILLLVIRWLLKRLSDAEEARDAKNDRLLEAVPLLAEATRLIARAAAHEHDS